MTQPDLQAAAGSSRQGYLIALLPSLLCAESQLLTLRCAEWAEPRALPYLNHLDLSISNLTGALDALGPGTPMLSAPGASQIHPASAPSCLMQCAHRHPVPQVKQLWLQHPCSLGHSDATCHTLAV